MATANDVERIDPETARREVEAGRALLVCAYDDRQRCRSLRLEGAIDMDDLQGLLPTLSKDTPMIFYCA
jgi:hypothetical protein